MSCSQGSVKPDNETSEAEIEEKELETLKDDDSPEKPSSEVCWHKAFELFCLFIAA